MELLIVGTSLLLEFTLQHIRMKSARTLPGMNLALGKPLETSLSIEQQHHCISASPIADRAQLQTSKGPAHLAALIYSQFVNQLHSNILHTCRGART
jgi:hypothetical protein